jgi:predicted Zn-dependent protease
VYKFFVVDKDEMNEFTTPGGNIYIFTGLLNKLKTDDELAFVLAHEVSHGAAKHTVKKFQAAMSYQLIGNILLSQVSEGTQRIAGMTSGAVMSLVFSAYGRQDEYQADRLGIKYMYLAGFDTQGSIGALTVLKNEAKETGKVPLILRTHPYLEDRIKMVQSEIDAVKSQFSAK